MKKFIITLFALLLASVFQLSAQNNIGSEEELKEKANELFEAEKLVEANPLYAQLLSLYPQDATYNYRYGACLLASDENKEKALKYLTFATAKPGTDPLAFYYRGRAHHLNYEFALAVKFYSRFKNKASSDQKEKYQIERKIEMCKNGNSLLSRLNEVQVIDKQSISEADFFRIYDLEGTDGKVIAVPEEFLSKEDKKRGESSIMYLAPGGKEVYYASYGKKGENGKDLFKRVKLGNGNWSDAVNLGTSINTPYDEDYAFLHPDGRTLYFASKGHSSMGGYDLFRSTFNQSIADWTAPENLDFAFSSADDDILFITDQSKSIAYFASNRNNEAGQYTVYKVLVEKAPAELSVIKGKFTAEDQSGDLKAKITVIDAASNQIVGTFETDKNGNYTIEIPSNGGTYQFNLETSEDAPIHTGMIEIPKQEELAVLGQELRLVGTGEDQTLAIKNIFDGSAANAENTAGPVVSSQVLRQKARLEVNIKEDQITADQKHEQLADQTDSPINTKQQEGSSTKETQSREEDLQESTTASNAANSNSDNQTNSVRKEELTAAANQLINKQKEVLDLADKAVDVAFEQAVEDQSEAKTTLNELAAQKASGASAASLEANQEYAGESIASLVFNNELLEDFQSIKKQKQETLQNTTELKGKLDQAIAAGQVSEAEKLLQEMQLQAEGKEEMDALLYLNQSKKEIKEQLRLNQVKTESFGAKRSALSAEKEQINEQLTTLRAAQKEASSAKRKEIAEKVSQLELDSADMHYQFVKATNDYDKAINRETALQLKLQEVELAESKLKSQEYEASKADLSQVAQLQNSTEELKSQAVFEPYNLEITSVFAENTKAESDAVGTSSNANSSSVDQESTATESVTETDLSPAATSAEAKDITTSLNSLNANYENQLRQNGGIEPEELSAAQAEERLTVYDAWEADLERALKREEDAKALASNEEDKKQYEDNIAKINLDLERIISNKNKLSEIVGQSTTVLAAQGQDQTIENTESKPLASSVISEEDLADINESSIINDPRSAFDFKQSFNYGGEASSNELKSAKRALAEAKLLNDQARKSKEDAFSLPSVEARNQAFQKANRLEDEAEKKQIKAAFQYAKVNQEEFYNNASMLEQINDYEAEFESSNLDIANLLADEAKSYYEQALNIREKVDTTNRLSRIEADLQKAYDLEMLALKKQGEALNMLDIINTEYESDLRGTNEAFVQESNALDQFKNEQTIYDAEVLAVKEASVAKQKGDSLTAIVNTLQKEADSLKLAAENLAVGSERDTLITNFNQKTEEAEQLKAKASVYYEREEQIKSGKDEELNQELAVALVKPYQSTISQTIDLDTVEVDDERAELVLNSQAYINYVNRAQARANLTKEATVAYEESSRLQDEQINLKKQAIALRSKAAQVEDSAEKERLIKSATVIEQRAAQNEAKIDSLNNLMKVKNLMVQQAERDMRNAIADLSEMEQAEIQKLAQENVQAEPIELKTESLADRSTSNTAEGQFTSAEQSQTSTKPEPLVEEQTNLDQNRASDNNQLAEVEQSREAVGQNESKPIDDNTVAERTAGSQGVNVGEEKSSIESTTNSEESEREVSPSQERITPNEKNETKQNLSTSVSLTEIPRFVKQAVFETLSPSESAYNSNKPIPLATKETMPEGLIYKVQVGAFRNPISQAHFKGFAPLMAEKTSTGITRYTAGFFVNERTAIQARNKIRSLGYSDAFVVALYNGERISINRARGIDPKQGKEESLANANKIFDASEGSSTSTSNRTKLSSEFSQGEVAKVQNIEGETKLIFTVQIGVFSKPLKAGTFNLGELYVKQLPVGLIRYNAGIYQTAAEAEQAKNRIVNQVKDAFVVAYYNGKRISINEAARIQNR